MDYWPSEAYSRGGYRVGVDGTGGVDIDSFQTTAGLQSDFSVRDDSVEEWMRFAESDPQLRVGGFLKRVLDKYRVLQPVIGRKRAEAVITAAQEAREDVLDEMLLNHPSKAWANEYKLTHKLVPRDSNHVRLAVDFRVPGLTSEPITGYSDEPEGVPCPVFEDKKKYFLEQFFSDTDVVEKFALSDRFVQSVKRCAVSNARAAAASLQRKLRDMGYKNVFVGAGAYSKSKNRARTAVMEAASAITARDHGAMAQIIDNKMFFHHDENGVILWTVEGPIEYCKEVVAVYNMNLAMGIEAPTQLLNMELAVLSINVHDVVNARTVTGVVEAHVDVEGIQPDEVEDRVGVTQTQASALLAMTDKILPITLDGRVVASAVRVTDRYALACEHVFQECMAAQPEAPILVAGEEFLQVKPSGHDVWVLGAKGRMHDAWRIRQARIGEKAVFLYSVGGRLEITSAAQVIQVDSNDVAVMAPKELRKGMSGAALISLSDMSLLGVYRAKSGRKAIVTVFDTGKYSDLADIEMSLVSVSLDREQSPGEILQRFWDRGYSGAIRAVRDALVPLSDGATHVGMAARFGSDLVTPIDPDNVPIRVEPVAGSNDVSSFSGKGRGPTFQVADAMRFKTPVMQGEASILHAVRKPAVDDKVIVIGRDRTSMYISDVVRVFHVGVNATRFYLEQFKEADLPLQGGLVVSYNDASVLGQFVGFERTAGGIVRGVCAEPYSSTAVTKTLASWLSDRYPILSPVAWSSGLEVILEYPAGEEIRQRFALLGRHAVRLAAVGAMDLRHVPVDAVVGQLGVLTASKALAKICDEIGLADLVNVEPGFALSQDSRRFALLLEAVLGMAWQSEEWTTFLEFCDILGLVGSAVTDVVAFAPSREATPLSAIRGSRPSSVIAGSSLGDVSKMLSGLQIPASPVTVAEEGF